MAEKEPGDDTPSLEMPSLGSGRKQKQVAPEESAQTTASEPVAEPAPEPGSAPDHDPAPTERLDSVPPVPAAGKQRRQLAFPAIGGMTASILTGAVVGLLTVAATWGSLRLCEVVQGTPACGNPGFFLLLAIMVAMVLIGGALLKAFGVTDPGSTSFLGMGLVAVVALLFLVELLFLWWMVLVIPAVAMAAYALAHWVTTAFVEPAESNLHR